MLLYIDEKDNRPIYLQLMNQIREQVSQGTLKAGDELPSVRELAATLGINLHTVRRAYTRLRDQGIIDMRLGRRARVARFPASPPDTAAGDSLKARFRELVTDALLAGLSPEAIRDLLEDTLQNQQGENR